ncbi:hypothetical protein [Flavobacterium chungnamense]|uniref:Pectate lyase superfamily protein domain-containing protein n=1 Tax=Flavobacterium chungnamense TaxID=706182 RepID=A0ABP7UTL9_9FLAO
MEIRYVKGHSSSGDGGGGIFIWRTLDIFTSTNPTIGIYSTDNNGTIIQSIVNGIPNNDGRWIRQYDGFINVLYFGAFGFGNDYTINLQNAIDFASLNSKINPTLKGSTVFIPNGSYVISNIILKNSITILGESITSTILYATQGTENEYMFEMERGLVIINISNLYLSGQKSQRGAFHFKSDFPLGPPFLGGLQNSKISDIVIFGFFGHGIFLEGGREFSEGLLPHQFNVFENVRVFNFSEFNNSLRITGQNGQLTFLNCEFDGNPIRDNNDVYTFKRGVNILIRNVKEYNPAVISFINCTCQYADYGFVIEWAENITIDNCWFEQLGVAISVKSNQISSQSGFQPSKSINVVNNRFANAAGFGSLNAPNNIKDGQCVNVSNSFVNVNNNFVVVTDPNGVFLDENAVFIIAYNNTIGGVSALGNTFSVNKLGRTFGIMQIIDVNAIDNSIDCSGHKLLFVNTSKTPIKIIKSSINAGEYLTIRADQGKITFVNTDNIFFVTPNTDNSFSIDNGQIVTFVKIDNIISPSIYETYQLVSIMREVI